MKEFQFEPIKVEGTATIMDTEEFESLIAEFELLETQKMLLEIDNERLVNIANKSYFLLNEFQKNSIRMYRISAELKELIDAFFVD